MRLSPIKCIIDILSIAKGSLQLKSIYKLQDLLHRYSYSDSKRSIATTEIPSVVFIGRLEGLILNITNTVLQGYIKCVIPFLVVTFHSLVVWVSCERMLCSHHMTSWPSRAALIVSPII